VGLQDLGERPVRDALAVRKAPAEDDPRGRALAERLRQELADEPALPDSRVAVDRDEVGTALRHDARTHRPQERELLVASDHRSAQAGNAAFGDLRRLLLEEDRGDELLLAPEIARAELVETEPPRGARRAFGDDDAAGVGRLLESRGDVHGISGHHGLARSRIGRGEDLSGVHPGPDLQRDAEARLEVGVHAFQAPPHPQCRTECPRRVVLVSGGNAERRHDRIADELLHRAALRLDLLAHGLEVGGEDLLQPFRIQLLAERRRAGHVREQDRDQPSFLAGGDVLLQERRTAAGTEPAALRALGAADGTCRNEGRST
jgi:hypothetical protein